MKLKWMAAENFFCYPWKVNPMADKKTKTKASKSTVTKKKASTKGKGKTNKKPGKKEKDKKPKEIIELDEIGQALNANQRLFCELYLATQPRNQTRAYMEAYGVTDVKSAESNSSALIRNHKVKAYIERAEKKLFKGRFAVTHKRIADELAGTAYARLSDFVEIKGSEIVFKGFESIPEELHGAIKSLDMTGVGKDQKCKITLNDPNKARELLGRYKKMFIDKAEIEFDVSDPLKALLQQITGKELGPPSERGKE